MGTPKIGYYLLYGPLSYTQAMQGLERETYQENEVAVAGAPPALDLVTRDVTDRREHFLNAVYRHPHGNGESHFGRSCSGH